MLPRELSKQVPNTHLMSEEECRKLGVQQSRLSALHDPRARTACSSL
ncbi:Cyclin-dependent kinases regulatory subunit 2 [Lemmus lemmus]